MLAALLALVGLGTLFGGLLGYAAERFKVGSDPIVQQLTNCYRKHSAVNVAFLAADPMLNP